MTNSITTVLYYSRPPGGSQDIWLYCQGALVSLRSSTSSQLFHIEGGWSPKLFVLTFAIQDNTVKFTAGSATVGKRGASTFHISKEEVAHVRGSGWHYWFTRTTLTNGSVSKPEAAMCRHCKATSLHWKLYSVGGNVALSQFLSIKHFNTTPLE